MKQNDLILQVLDAREARRGDRRRFIKIAGGTTAAVAGATMLSGCFDGDDNEPEPTPEPTPTPPAAITDADVLNFALNLEYLKAQFYAYAATAAGLPANLLSGTGPQGAVYRRAAGALKDPMMAQYAREIAADELAHVAFLRQALGSSTAVSQPAIDVGSSATGPFAAAARAAGLIGANQEFDPYASDENFLLGAYIFEDVGVTAYKGAAPLLTNKTFLEPAAGIWLPKPTMPASSARCCTARASKRSRWSMRRRRFPVRATAWMDPRISTRACGCAAIRRT